MNREVGRGQRATLAAPDGVEGHNQHPGEAPDHGKGRNPRKHNVRVILRQTGFRRLLAVRLVTQIADGVFQAGLAGSVLFNPQNAASPSAVAAGFAVLLLPYSLIGPYLGVLLDRWSRRTVIVAGNVARVCLALPIVALIWSGQQGASFGALVLISIGISRLFLAATAAATPHVVDDEHLVTANAFASTLGSLGFSFGLMGVAGLVRLGLPTSFHGYGAVAAAAPIGYLAAAVLARRSFPPAALGPDVGPRTRGPLGAELAMVGRGTVAGFRHLSRRRAAGSALAALGAHRVLYGVLALGVLLMYRDAMVDSRDLRAVVSGVGSAFVAASLGTFLGSLVTPSISRKIGAWRWLVALFASGAVAIALFGGPVTPALLPVAIGWISVVSQATKIVVDTALQHECDDSYRGRVFSVNDTLFNLCFVVGTWLGSLVLPSNGRSTTVVLATAAGYLALSAGYAYACRRSDPARRDDHERLEPVGTGEWVIAPIRLPTQPTAATPPRLPPVAAARARVGGP